MRLFFQWLSICLVVLKSCVHLKMKQIFSSIELEYIVHKQDHVFVYCTQGLAPYINHHKSYWIDLNNFIQCNMLHDFVLPRGNGVLEFRDGHLVTNTRESEREPSPSDSSPQ